MLDDWIDEFLKNVKLIREFTHQYLNTEHLKVLQMLADSLQQAASDFAPSHRDKPAFQTLRLATNQALQTAEHAFEQEPGFWRNILIALTPIINAVLKALNVMLTYMPSYQVGLFKVPTTHATKVWGGTRLKDDLLSSLERGDDNNTSSQP